MLVVYIPASSSSSDLLSFLPFCSISVSLLAVNITVNGQNLIYIKFNGLQCKYVLNPRYIHNILLHYLSVELNRTRRKIEQRLFIVFLR